MPNEVMTLASLALLKARFDIEKKDVIDTLIPFASHVIPSTGNAPFRPEDLRQWLSNAFGLQLPLHPVGLVLNRMVKRGIVRRDNRLYILQKKDHDHTAFEKAKEESTSHFNATVEGLIQHTSSTLNRTLTPEEAEHHLHEYIDEYAIECIRAYAAGDSVRARGRPAQTSRYMVSSYVRSISKADPQKFQYFATVLTGRMLSNALLAADLTAAPMKFVDTIVYLDTTIILQLIGVLGEDAQGLAKETLSLYRAASARLAVFTHTRSEIDVVLRNAEKALETIGGLGSVIVSLREAGKKPSDVAWIRGNMNDILLKDAIETVDTPPHDRAHQIDEAALEKEMIEAGLFYRNAYARNADINSVRSVYALRAGKSPRRVEECNALFVTNNAALSRAAYSYGRNMQEFRDVSPVITDFSLTNIVWLKSPLAAAALPAKILSANCYAALRPSDELWSAILDELTKLEASGRITAHQHQYMRYELRVRRELMNLTLGDESQLSEEKILQVLDRHEQEIAQPWKEKHANLEADHTQTKAALSNAQSTLAEIYKRVEGMGTVTERIISGGLLVLCVGILITAEVLSGKSPQLASAPPSIRWACFVAGLIVNGLALLGTVTGFQFWNPISHLARATRTRLLNWLKRQLAIPSPPPQ